MAKRSNLRTAAYILLDRSGSMQTLWEEALGSINGYVKGLPEDSRVVLAVFDSLGYDLLRDTTAGEWHALTKEDAQPRGGTPLFDASARMMWKIMDDAPDRAVFVTMTDGEENQSQHFKQVHVKNMVKVLESKDYQVIFLGANFDKVGDVASQYGVNLTRSSYNMSAGSFGATMTGLATQSMNYMTTGAAMNAADLGKATNLDVTKIKTKTTK